MHRQPYPGEWFFELRRARLVVGHHERATAPAYDYKNVLSSVCSIMANAKDRSIPDGTKLLTAMVLSRRTVSVRGKIARVGQGTDLRTTLADGF